ncbi:MAG: transposase [Chloroflexi bacterium]|nr:transposase [Chloroflexota bacterium]
MAKYKTYTQHQVMLLPPRLEEKVPPKHLARMVSQVVDELDITEIERSYSDLGCRDYHPMMLLKMLIYGYSIGIKSSRRLPISCHINVVKANFRTAYRCDLKRSQLHLLLCYCGLFR